MNAKLPNTNRQFTSDYEYAGGSMTKKPAQMRYGHMYNANLNEVREGTLVGVNQLIVMFH